MKPSLTLAVAARADKLRREGLDIVAFGVGEPDFETPAFIRDAVIEQLKNGKGLGKYTAVPGTPELRATVAAELTAAHGVPFTAEQIIVSAGAKHSLYNLFMSMLDDGDEVIVPTPAWVSYTDLISMAGGKPVLLETSPVDRYQIDAEQLERLITPRTRAVLLNSPCNPTGAVYDEATLRSLSQVLLRNPHVMVITDDIYRKLVYGVTWVSILRVCPELAPRVIIIDGVSKTYAMTGWRIGYCAGPVELVKAMSTLQSQSTTNAAAIAQAAAIVALRGPGNASGGDPIEAMRLEFDKRRVRMVELLSAIPGVKLTAPRGAFYCFPDLNAYIGKPGIADDMALADYLLDKARTAVVPGSGFYAPGFVRLSYATSMDRIEEGVKRMTEALQALG
ncbi:MAG: pyridoxal phosphate-dependent aminotransferase [Polyangia bacterium]